MNKQAYFVLIVSKAESGKALQDAHVSTKYVYHTADRYAGTYEYAVLLLWSTRYVLLLHSSGGFGLGHSPLIHHCRTVEHDNLLYIMKRSRTCGSGTPDTP